LSHFIYFDICDTCLTNRLVSLDIQGLGLWKTWEIAIVTSYLIKKKAKKFVFEPGVAEHTWNPNMWGVEARGSQIPGQHGLHSETCQKSKGGHQWLTSVILAAQEAEIRRIKV
jgi:hypothetical protein